MKFNKARAIINRFNVTQKKSKFNISFNKIDATNKWVEYSLDVLEIKSLMKTEDFITRCELENTLKKVENKIEWMYKHPNFDLIEASREFKRAKKLLNY
jgi:uncharacterized protein YlxP (DUF503 family)